MGIVSVNDLDRLFWSGRYCERAVSVYERYTSLPSFDLSRYDFAVKMGIMCDITTPETEILGEDGVVLTAIRGWHDNAVMLRQALGSRCVMTAEHALADAESGSFELLPLRAYAFFGMASDRLKDATARAAVESGRMCEQLDIMSRLNESAPLLRNSLDRLIDATRESAAVEGMMSRAMLELIDSDISAGSVGAVSARTEFLESTNEYS